jgi:hypothetical protein
MCLILNIYGIMTAWDLEYKARIIENVFNRIINVWPRKLNIMTEIAFNFHWLLFKTGFQEPHQLQHASLLSLLGCD